MSQEEGDSTLEFDIEPYLPRLMRYALSLTKDKAKAEDLVQDTCLRALSRKHLWEPGTNLCAWLFTILHNSYVNYVRRKVRELEVLTPSEGFERIASRDDIEDSLYFKEVQKILMKMDPEQRRVILAVGGEGDAYQVCADLLGVPIGTVRSRLARGRERLRILTGEESSSVSEDELARVKRAKA